MLGWGEAQFSQSKRFNNYSAAYIRFVYLAWEGTLVPELNKTFTSGHSFEIQTLCEINPISDQVYRRYLLYIGVSQSLWLVTTLL